MKQEILRWLISIVQAASDKMKAGKPIDVPLGANQQFYKRIYSKWLHLKGDTCNEFSVGFISIYLAYNGKEMAETPTCCQ